MGKGVRDVTTPAARETTEAWAQWKRMSDTPAQQFSNAILGNDFSIVEKYVENKGNLEILLGLWIK